MLDPRFQTCIHAARSGSFARTAEHFGVPPSDISQTVRRLEEELGVRLFDRKANAVTLNRRGEEFARQVQQGLTALDGAVSAARDDGERGEVHICVNCNRRIVMDAVEQFRRRWSAVSIHTRTFCDPTAEQFDLIVSADDDTLTGYHRQKLLSEQLAIAVSRSSPYDRWDGALSSLADVPFITMGEGTSMYRLTQSLCRAAGFTPVRKIWDFDADHPIQHYPLTEDIPTIRHISEVLSLLDDTPT